MASNDPQQPSPDVNPEQFARMLEGSGEVREPGWFVILGVQRNEPSPAQIKAFAEGMELDTYSARQRLIVPSPRILRREVTRKEAMRWLAWLKASSLRGFVMPEDRLASFAPVVIHFFEAADSSIRFERPGGDSHSLHASEILCLVAGETSQRHVRESVRKDALLGDVGFTSETVRSDTEFVIDVHCTPFPQPFRLHQFSADFGRFFPGRPMSSVPMMREIHQKLKAVATASRHFEDFAKVIGALGDSRDIMQRSRSQNLHLGLRGTTLAGVTNVDSSQQSDRPAFDLYSQLMRQDILAGD